MKKTLNLPYGSKYVGEHKNGQLNGQGTYVWSNGDKHVGEYKNNMRNGQGISTSLNGEKYIGKFKNDMRNGKRNLFISRWRKICWRI